MIRSVRARLTAINIGFIVLLLLATGLAIHFRIRSLLVDGIDRELKSLVESARTDSPRNGGPAPQPPGILKSSERVVQVFSNGNSSIRLDASRAMPQLFPVPFPRVDFGPKLDDPVGFQEAQKGRPVFRNHREGTAWERTISQPVVRDGNVVAVIQMSRDLTPVDQEVAALDAALLTLSPLALLLGAFGGWVLVGGTMRPIRLLTESARRLQANAKSDLLPVVGHDEFSELATTLNGALESQRQTMRQMERFTGDAGHELRTPLGAVKGAAGYLLHVGHLSDQNRPFAETIDRAADRMARLIDDLLVLARRDGGQQLCVQPGVSVKAIVEEVLDDFGRPEIVVSNVAGISVDCDPEALRRILTNLLANALAYTHTRIEVAASVIGDDLTLKVSDDGEGISPEHLARLGERFYRPDVSRARPTGGTGLGLAIVKSLCEAHGGCLRIESAIGQGTVAIVTLPVHASRSTSASLAS